MDKKILIVGIGGVGGYFGGLLARCFHERSDVSVYFMARGENLKAIHQKGLLITKGDIQFYARPDIVSDNPQDFGKVDYIILCTKSYDIETTVERLSSCVKDDTVFLPLLNGVDSAEKIKIALPADIKERVWNKFLDLLPEATTSMHSDYLADKKQTEVQPLTGYIVAQADKYNIEVSKYREMYNRLINK